MDERDLRKGNLIFSFGMFSVVNSCQDGWIQCALKDGSGVAFSCSEAEPVIITDKILDWLEFGENQHKGIRVFEKFVGECYVTVDKYGINKHGCNWRVHIDNERFETIGHADIQYVHELQNIIRLCTGCDLDVKIFKFGENN